MSYKSPAGVPSSLDAAAGFAYAGDCAAGAVTIRAGEAVLEGVSLKDTPAETPISYDEKDDCILGLGEFSSASYRIPEGIDGSYDIYLQISKGASAFVCGSTPVTVSVNGGERFVPSVPAAPCSMEQMGMQGNPTYQADMGLFLVRSDVPLKRGDMITIGGVAGSEYFFNETYCNTMPAIGSLTLYPAGTRVEQGYEGNKFVITEEEKDPSDPLSGLQIAWLGSSVTYGQATGGYSMADTIAENHAATESFKYAISGTTLADYAGAHAVPTDGDGAHGSYVCRMKQISKNRKFDLFIVQLSTNDASGGVPMGKISENTDPEQLDTATVIGAMEYIIGYVRSTWGCPVMFYTGTKFNSKQYSEMVDVLLQLKDKWNIGVIDLWNDEELNAVDDETRASYIAEDGIHPFRKGYAKWWAPAFEKAIKEYLA